MFLYNGKNSTIYWFHTSKDKGVESWSLYYTYFAVNTIYNIFINNLQLFISNSFMCVPCWLLQHHNCCVVLFSFIAFLCCYCFLLLHSHDLYRVLLCKFCYSNSFYKVLLHLWYLTYHSCMYVTIIRIKICLSINNVISVVVNTK